FLGVTTQKDLTPMHAFELFDGFAQRKRIGLIEKHSGLSFNDCFLSAARPISNHRAAGGISLERGHAEIFLTREQECATTRGVVVNNLVRLSPEELDSVIPQLFQPSAIRSVTNNDQPAVRSLAGFDRQIDS